MRIAQTLSHKLEQSTDWLCFVAVPIIGCPGQLLSDLHAEPEKRGKQTLYWFKSFK